jgi:dipeptidase
VCDCLVALYPATANGRTLVAKNSDRPPNQVQVVERFPPRRERTTCTTHLEIEGREDDTISFVGSRPTWMWGVEHGVNVAGVAADNATIYTTLARRRTARPFRHSTPRTGTRGNRSTGWSTAAWPPATPCWRTSR